MKKYILILLIITVIILVVFSSTTKTQAYSLGCSEYGMAYEDYTGYCKCMSGYVFGENFMGEPYCVSADSLCHDKFGIMSRYNSLSESCECSYGYVFGEDSIGRTQCISENDACQDQYGYNARSTYGGKCECSYGYEFTQVGYGQGLECKSCSSKYGIHTSYNSLTNQCECSEGYTLDDSNQCVEKQNNVYFLLLDIDESSESIIVQSDYSKDNYLLEYGLGCDLYIEYYLDKNLVINLGTDFDIDLFDKIVLQNHDATCSIMSYELIYEDSFKEEDEYFYISENLQNYEEENIETNTFEKETIKESEPEEVFEEKSGEMLEGSFIINTDEGIKERPGFLKRIWLKIKNWF